MKKQIGGKFWFTLVVFSLMGQVAWVVENMYFNVFIYKMFHASASDISLMVSASAIAATLTTWLIGALSDRVGKRKIFICGGYMIWGISILAFCFIRMDILTPFVGTAAEAATLGVTLVILFDCIMTFFGSSANDACFNAWLTDMGDESNRGKIEGINSMMPLVAILVVFGGFMAFDLDKSSSWVLIYAIIGIAVIVIGFLGFFLIQDQVVPSNEKRNYWENLIYSFRPSVVSENKLLYAVVGAFAVFGISIQIFMPYLILYYEKTLGMDNYVLVMAPAIILASIFTAIYGKLYDQLGFNRSVVPVIALLMAGYVLLYFCTANPLVFLGSLFMMSGYLGGMAVFGAMIRDHIPEDKAGLFQGLRIFGQVFIPGVIGPGIGAWVLRNAELITNGDGTTSFLPNHNIYLAAFLAAAVLLMVLFLIFHMIRTGHYELHPENRNVGWNSYPRPQMKRNSFVNLNGEWRMNEKKILVPFCPESQLSGVNQKAPGHMHYSRTFYIEQKKENERVILHFGAVDQIAKVSVNHQSLGQHEGGYLPFSYDITEALAAGENLLEVEAIDTLSKKYPYGKQRKLRGGMWYTPVSGIWKTVWMECVPKEYIEKVSLDANEKGVKVSITSNGLKEYKVTIFEDAAMNHEDTVSNHENAASNQMEKNLRQDEGSEAQTEFGCNQEMTYGAKIYTKDFMTSEFYIDANDFMYEDGSPCKAELWSVEHPYLYHMVIEAEQDKVATYFGLRSIKIEKVDGIPRVLLNGNPIFLHGVLDQGYYCDGIYLPANEAEYEKDILRMKELGINCLRKHIKIEPDYFYYACDRLGMLVLQDMVNNGHYSFIQDTALPTIGRKKRDDTRRIHSRRRKEIFVSHMEETIHYLYSHPSVIGYTIFNEGWGQFDADDIYEKVKKMDSTRLIDITSGWFHQKKFELDSRHIYFDTVGIEPAKEVPIFLSECGGYSFGIEGHVFSKYVLFGYGSYKNSEELTDAVLAMYEKMVLSAISTGLCGCIYTQLSDVEDETNGFYTYDRAVCKVDKEKMKQLREKIDFMVDESKKK